MPRALAEAVAAELVAAGIDRLFGLPGGGPNLEKVGAGAAAGVEFVLAHGETAACITAGTYGVLTGRPGVCVVTRGPGVTSAANGVAQATLDRFPLLLVSDTVPAASRARVPHQRLDQLAHLAPVAKWTGTLGTDRPRDVVAAALALAAAAPAGAVHLDFDPTAGGDAPPPVPRPPALEPEALAAAAKLARTARHPVFLIGAEAIPWAGDVRRVVAASGCPAFTTYHAKGTVPDGGDQTAGLFTNGAIERPLLDRADLVVAVGLDPVEPIPAPWRGEAPVLAINPWEVSDPYYEPAVAVTGPVGEALAALEGSLHGDWDPDAGRRARERANASLYGDGGGFRPHDVVEAVREWAPPGAVLTVDAGAHMLVAMPLWDAAAPRDVLISNGLATMGFSVPAAIGSALARPTRPVVCFVGDGGLGMTLAELETIARLDLDVTVVVFNDAALSLIEIKQAAHHGGPGAVRYRPVDFAAIARACGLPAAGAGGRAELERALGEAGRGPRLVDARVDPSAYRHVIRATRG